MHNARCFRERIDAGEALVGPSVRVGVPLSAAGHARLRAQATCRGRYLGVGMGTDVASARQWIDRGIQWVQLGVDFMYLRERMRELYTAIHPATERPRGGRQ